MSNIIHLVPANDGPRVDSREIAEHLGVDHRSAFRLIDRYFDKFGRFGQVRFEIALGYREQGGGKAQSFALLNEDQCYFLLALSRNTAKVVDLKADLVAAFGEARRNGSAQRLSVMEKLMALEVKDAASKVKGRFGSKLMHERKGDIRTIRPQRLVLERELQPELALTA